MHTNNNEAKNKVIYKAGAIGTEVNVESLTVGEGSRSSLLTRKTGPGFTMLKDPSCIRNTMREETERNKSYPDSSFCKSVIIVVHCE